MTARSSAALAKSPSSPRPLSQAGVDLEEVSAHRLPREVLFEALSGGSAQSPRPIPVVKQLKGSGGELLATRWTSAESGVAGDVQLAGQGERALGHAEGPVREDFDRLV